MSAVGSEIQPQSICAVILAGGRGSRMGGVDKGLQAFKGQPLVTHAVQRLQAQTLGTPGLIGINANRNAQEYAALGHAVWADALEDFAGPLAGFHCAMQHCKEQTGSFDYLLIVPCDSPLFPLDLLERLATALTESQAAIAMVAIPEPDRNGVNVMRAQPVFCLLRMSLQPSLGQFLAAGGRKIDAWTQLHPTAIVPFDDARAFSNANTLAELQQLEQP
jgi:molybdenum cofactor guanylyltransferase